MAVTCDGCLYLSPIAPPYWCAHRVHYGFMEAPDRGNCGGHAFTARERERAARLLDSVAMDPP